MSKPKILVLTGQGINCDRETARAFEEAGAKSYLTLISSLISGEVSLDDYDGLALPGGFANADDIAAGRIMGINLEHSVGGVYKLIEDGKIIVGICNGFQFMIDMGMLPATDGDYKKHQASLITNESGMFRDDWVNLEVNENSPCIFTKDVDKIYLPIRHGEGYFWAPGDVIEKMNQQNQVLMRYVGPDGERNPGHPHNPNGSIDGIAAICDPTGRIYGGMPHPEAANKVHHYPRWTRDHAEAEENADKARQMFKNVVDYLTG